MIVQHAQDLGLGRGQAQWTSMQKAGSVMLPADGSPQSPTEAC